MSNEDKLAEALRRLLDQSMVAMTDESLCTPESAAAWDNGAAVLSAYRIAAYEAKAEEQPPLAGYDWTDVRMELEASGREDLSAWVAQWVSLGKCGELCERAKLCATCARELDAAPIAQPAAQPVPAEVVAYRYCYQGQEPALSFSPQPSEVPESYYWQEALVVRDVAQAKAEPLTEERLQSLAAVHFHSKLWSFARSFARAIERAHGIGAATTKD